MHERVFLSLLVLAVLGIAPAGDADASDRNWPGFRGPLHTGVAPGADPPLEWSEEKNVRFKVELPGSGHASPIVWGNRIYVLSAAKTDKTVEPASPEGPTHIHRYLVSALDRETGKTVWETVVREALPHEVGHKTASHASASPVTDGKHIWASFGSHGLYCLDMDGKIKWEKDLGDMSTRNEFGGGSSPVIHGDMLLVNWDHEGDSFIVALDKLTGEQRWKVARDEPTSWTSPLVLRDGERDVAVVAGATAVRAYDLKTGKEVWSCRGLGLNCVPMPVADETTVFVMSGWREAAGMAIRYVGARGDLTDGEAVAWRAEEGLSYVPSPVLLDGKLYYFQRFSGILSCQDLTTGEACYERQRVEGLDNIYASPVGAGGRIYAVSREGTTVVFRAGKSFEVLATSRLDDSFSATPAIVGDTIYLRGEKYLYALAQD